MCFDVEDESNDFTPDHRSPNGKTEKILSPGDFSRWVFCLFGIQSFFNIVQKADRDRLLHNLYLLYSNRRPEDAPFLEVLEKLEKTNPNFRFVATMTEMPHSKKKWDGETGLIDKAMLSRYLSDLEDPFTTLPDLPPWLRT